MWILNNLIDHGLFHFWEACYQFPKLVLGNDSYGAIRHAFDAIGRITIEHDLYLAHKRALLEVTQEDSLPRINIFEDLTDASPCNDELPKVLIVLAHELLLRFKKAYANPLEQELNLILLILEHADIRQNALVLEHQDAKLHTRSNYTQELFHFVLRLQRRRVFHYLMPHFLLQAEIQL